MAEKLRHYEIVFLVHPDQSEQVPNFIQRYEGIIKNAGGNIHRLEDWGKRTLAYPIQKLTKAHYVLMNVECDEKTLEEITTNFRYHDAILRNLVLKCEKALTEVTPILKALQTVEVAAEVKSPKGQHKTFVPPENVIPDVVEENIEEELSATGSEE